MATMKKFPCSFKSAKVIVISVLMIATDFGPVVNGYVRGNDWKDLLLTSKEKNALDVFKQRVIHRLPEKFMESDFYLIRWLRAKNFNLRAAQEMLFESIKWREQNKIANILSEDFSDLREDFPITLEGHDKQNRPIATLEMGDWDLRSAVLQGRTPRIMRYLDHLQESVLHKILSAQKDGKNVTRAMVLVDIEGFNLMQHLCPSCLSIFVRLTLGMESHYPGFWEEILVVNAPSGSRVGLEAVRPVMSQQTREILKIFDQNKIQWLEYLDERIDGDQRTSAYGGTMKSSHD